MNSSLPVPSKIPPKSKTDISQVFGPEKDLEQILWDLRRISRQIASIQHDALRWTGTTEQTVVEVHLPIRDWTTVRAAIDLAVEEREGGR